MVYATVTHSVLGSVHECISGIMSLDWLSLINRGPIRANISMLRKVVSCITTDTTLPIMASYFAEMLSR